jgi:hypothetical protein
MRELKKNATNYPVPDHRLIPNTGFDPSGLGKYLGIGQDLPIAGPSRIARATS